MIIDITSAKKNPNQVYEFGFKFNPDKGILNNYLAEFEKEAEVKGSYYYFDGNIYVDAKIDFFIKCPCDRCLKMTIFKENIDFSEIFFNYSEDKEDYRYSGDKIDLTASVTEYIILNLPNSIICKEDCKGLCYTCGKNLNHGKCGCLEESAKNPFSILKKKL